MRDILVKSPLEARLEHSARQYDVSMMTHLYFLVYPQKLIFVD